MNNPKIQLNAYLGPSGQCLINVINSQQYVGLFSGRASAGMKLKTNF